MSQRSGKVIALFPQHTTDMMSFPPFFFFLVAAWAAILVCAESLLMGLHADVQTGFCREGVCSCLSDSLLVRLSAHLSGCLSSCLFLLISLRATVRYWSVYTTKDHTFLVVKKGERFTPFSASFLEDSIWWGKEPDGDEVEGKIIQTQLPKI